MKTNNFSDTFRKYPVSIIETVKEQAKQYLFSVRKSGTVLCACGNFLIFSSLVMRAFSYCAKLSH